MPRPIFFFILLSSTSSLYSVYNVNFGSAMMVLLLHDHVNMFVYIGDRMED